MKEVYEVTEKDGTWGALFVIWGALKEDQASDETVSVKFLDLSWTSYWKNSARSGVWLGRITMKGTKREARLRFNSKTESFTDL